MWSAQLLSQLLPLWPLLLLSVLPPAQGSSHRSPPAPARP
ncbi:RIKEN cDNA C530028O21, isoform CRA_c, partial [Mus musculus]